MEEHSSEVNSGSSSQKFSSDNGKSGSERSYSNSEAPESQKSSLDEQKFESHKSSSNSEKAESQKYDSSIDESLSQDPYQLSEHSKNQKPASDVLSSKNDSESNETNVDIFKNNMNAERKKFYHVENLSLKEPIKNCVFTEIKGSCNHTHDPERRIQSEDTARTYTPEMPPIEECDFIDELGIEAYNKIKEVRDQIQKEYPLKLSVHEDDLKDLKCYRGHKYEGKPFTDYVYYGCIDTQEYENTGVTIFHGPGCFLLSTGLLREGIFQGGQL